jgi:tRNA dimethylallyltransferase
MNKLLVIVGPTATGKTSLALELASKYNGELISADSRQVYKGLDIGTGKDKPKGAKILGLDLVEPTEDFSVADYQKYAQKIIKKIDSQNKLPILVGGTGLYIKAVLEGIETSTIPKNQKLRTKLEGKSPSELYSMLLSLNKIKAQSLNNSDKNNSRRLVRAIEIASLVIPDKHTRHPELPPRHPELVSGSESLRYNSLIIALTAPKEHLNNKITKRVNKRIKQGFEQEVQSLLASGVTWDHQSMSSLGYRQWKDYIEGNITKKEAIQNWIKEEQKYARRQLTWFKRAKGVNWFDISSSNWQHAVVEEVQKWYSQSTNDEKARKN